MVNREHIVVEYRNGRRTVYLGPSSPPIYSMQQYRALEALAQELGADLKDPNRKAEDWLAREFKAISSERLQLPPTIPPPFSFRSGVDELTEYSRRQVHNDLRADVLQEILKKLRG